MQNRPAAWSLAIARAAALAIAVAGCPRSEPKPAGDAAAGAHGAHDAGDAAPATHALGRPRDAFLEVGVLTDRPEAELAALIAPASLAAMLESRYCGPPRACDAVRAFVATAGRVEVSLTTTAEWGLPAENSLATMAAGLAPKERAALAKLPTVIVVHAAGKVTPEHLVARTAFALAGALAEKVRGYVYDETTRRIETAAQATGHAITAPLGEPVFREDRVVVQSYLQDDGTARLISLGMRRFGAADLEVRGAQPGAGRTLGAILNAVAARLAAGALEAPLTVTLDDPRARGKSAVVDLVPPERQTGDPDNVVLRIVPAGGASAAGYDQLVAAFFGDAERLVTSPDDAALAAATARARRAFPAMTARWRREPAPRPKLMVKLPFPMSEHDGTEWMWVEVTAVQGNEIEGTLANSPSFATSLHAGSRVRGRATELHDAMLMLPDGGTVGGETTKLLEGRP